MEDGTLRGIERAVKAELFAGLGFSADMSLF